MARLSSSVNLLLLLAAATAAAGTAAGEKEAYFRFFWHDVFTRPNATSVIVAQPPNMTAAYGFGTVVVFDDAMTEGPELTSRLLGRAQGLYVIASQTDTSLLMSMNLVFTEGEYNGSSLAVLGRNPVSEEVREIPVVGGSGRLRLARGYALLKTYSFDDATGNAVVEYNVTVALAHD